MTNSSPSVLRKKWPLLALVLAAIVALILVIWQLQTSPETNDAYVYTDTIDVVPEVSGRIVEMPIRDNQRVKKGDLLFRLDPRPYQAMLDDARARLTTLDAQIMLTRRTIKAQEYNAQSVAAAVERAKALVKQTTSSRTRLEPLVPQGFASQEDLDQARTAEKAARAELDATLLQAKQASAAVTGVDAMVAQRAGILAQEIVPVQIIGKKGAVSAVREDEHPRAETTLEQLAGLKTPFRKGGVVTAGNASGVNDGACALLLASESALSANDLHPLARVVGVATAGVAPRIMGFGPAPAVRKVLAQTGLTLEQMDVIELNEAFAAQALAVTRDLGLADDAPHVNPNGGAIALGHPLGASGGRLAMTAAYQLRRTGGRYALCTMCIGVGQGIALIIERV